VHRFPESVSTYANSEADSDEIVVANTTKNFDYVIVGGGTAGCVLAYRLSKSAANTVLLIEAGPPISGLMSKIPAALDFALHDDRFNWCYATDPEPYMGNRRMSCPRGRGLGGSSSINGMQFIRGNPNDFDNWASNGLPDWDYSHCLPYFKRMECFERGGDAYRGDQGPLHVSAATIQTPLDQAFLDAALQAGHGYSDDNNGFRQDGFGLSDKNTYRGRRWSAFDAYLKPALARENLHVETGCLTHRIIFDRKSAIGVEYDLRGELTQVYAEKEVLISAGSINSPQLLMLSGVGDAEQLNHHGLPVVQHLPGVGKNLQDHLDLRVQVKCKQPVSHYSSSIGIGRATAGLKWLVTRSGVCATNLLDVAGYICSRAELEFPNIQSTFMAIAASYDGSHSFAGHGYQAHIDLMKPMSRGSITLQSANPKEAPSILFNYLKTEEDRRVVIEGFRLTRTLLAQQSFDNFRDGELVPGSDVNTDKEIMAWAKVNGETEYHPTSSCSMGLSDYDVVDGDLKVHEIDSLRVVDASIMPEIVTANTHATTLMIAEKAADNILNNSALTPLSVPVFRK
jgi:choline dehydrogenase